MRCSGIRFHSRGDPPRSLCLPLLRGAVASNNAFPAIGTVCINLSYVAPGFVQDLSGLLQWHLFLRRRLFTTGVTCSICLLTFPAFAVSSLVFKSLHSLRIYVGEGAFYEEYTVGVVSVLYEGRFTYSDSATLPIFQGLVIPGSQNDLMHSTRTVYGLCTR